MPLAAIDALDNAVAGGTPQPAYLLFGDDDFLKDEKVREAVAAWTDPGTREFNVDLLRGGETEPGQLTQALDALPMLAARRVVVLRDLSSLKKSARGALDRYLASPSPDTVLLLVAGSGWKPEAALVERVTAVEFGVPSDSQAITWVTARAKTMSLTIDPDAARLLLTATGPDLAHLAGELQKLRDYSSSGTITTADVDAVVGVTPGSTATDIIDLVCAREGKRAAALVPTTLRQPKASAVGLVMTLTTHLLGIGQALMDRDRRVSQRQQAQNLYALLGEARSAPVGRPWSEAVRVIGQSADRWDPASVSRALRLLHDADSALKNTGVSRDDQVLQTLVLTMCARVRASRAA